MLYWKYMVETADKFTRANKQSIVIAVMLIVAIVYCIAYFSNKKRKPNTEAL
jgi:uncharacterized protein YpmB